MRTILAVVIVLALVAVLVVDGLDMYAAHRTAVEVAEGAAEQAAQVYAATGSETAAQRTVEGIAKEARVQVISADYHSETTRWYQVTVRAEPATHVLGHLPYVRSLLGQESTAVVHF